MWLNVDNRSKIFYVLKTRCDSYLCVHTLYLPHKHSMDFVLSVSIYFKKSAQCSKFKNLSTILVEITKDSKIELYEIKTTNDYKLFEIWGELTKRLFYNRTVQHSIWFGYILQQSNKNVNYIQIECQLYSILYYTTSHHIITLHHSV